MTRHFTLLALAPGLAVLGEARGAIVYYNTTIDLSTALAIASQ